MAQFAVEHGLRQPAGLRVLLADVVAAEESDGAEVRAGAVGETRARSRDVDTTTLRVSHVRIPGNGAESQNGPRLQQRELTVEPAPARLDLVRGRPIVGWNAPCCEGDVDPVENESVVAMGTRRLAGESRTVQRRVEKVAGPVAGEGASGAVSAVRAGREAEDDERSRGIAEPGDRLSPVTFVEVATSLRARDLFAPGHEPRARGAAHEARIELREIGDADHLAILNARLLG